MRHEPQPASGAVPAALLLRRARDRLRAAGIGTPGLDARLLLQAALELSHEALAVEPAQPVPDAAAARFEECLRRRLGREPVSRILGRREFYGRSFLVSPATFDPRGDSETVIEAALAAVGWQGRRDDPLRILDLGTGTGCLLVTLLCELPQAAGLGTDLEEATLAVARANAERHMVGARASFRRSDWWHGAGGAFDLIVCNPPYVPSAELADLDPEVREHDPAAALDGGSDGLDAVRRILPELPSRLSPRGIVALEAGAGQAGPVAAMLEALGFGPARTLPLRWRDLAGRERCLLAQVGRAGAMAEKTFGNGRANR